MFLLSAAAANLPFFSLFAVYSTGNLKHTLLYLAVFSTLLGLTMFITYLLPIKNNNVAVVAILAIWSILNGLIFIFGGV